VLVVLEPLLASQVWLQPVLPLEPVQLEQLVPRLSFLPPVRPQSYLVPEPLLALVPEASRIRQLVPLPVLVPVVRIQVQP